MKCQCELSEDGLREQISALVNEYGDVPPDSVKPLDIDLRQWKVCCPEDDPRRVVSVGKMEDSVTDWYSCTIKSLVTHPEYQERGLATEIAESLLEDAVYKSSCLVCQADITEDNIGSRTIFEKKLGFEVVSDFCMPWERKTAVVVQKDLSPREQCEP